MIKKTYLRAPDNASHIICGSAQAMLPFLSQYLLVASTVVAIMVHHYHSGRSPKNKLVKKKSNGSINKVTCMVFGCKVESGYYTPIYIYTSIQVYR